MYLHRSRDYQLSALHLTDNVAHCAYFVDMRMGKCHIGIRRIRRWQVHGKKLIVCPNSAIDSWQEELCNHGENPAVELIGTYKKRHDLLEKISNNTWCIINKEGHRALPEIRLVNWEAVILDESRFIANAKSAVSKFYTKNFRNVPHRIIMTGTPDFKNKLDYFQQLYFMNNELLPYSNFWEFRNKACITVGYDYILKKKHSKILEKILKKNAVVMRRKDYDIGRKKVYIQKTLALPRKLRPAYNTLEDEFILEYKGDVLGKTIYAMRTHTWLMQMCGGFIDNKLVWDGKIKLLLEILTQELSDEQVVIFCRFKDEIHTLTEVLNKAMPNSTVCMHGDLSRKQKAINKKVFISGVATYFVSQPSVVAHGVDLKNATAIIYYSQPPGEELRAQTEERIITLADEKTVLIIDILVKNSVDMDARDTYLNNETQRDMFERLIARRKNGN